MPDKLCLVWDEHKEKTDDLGFKFQAIISWPLKNSQKIKKQSKSDGLCGTDADNDAWDS